MDIYWYASKYGMSNFDKATLKLIRRDLYNDFLVDIGHAPLKHDKIRTGLHNILGKIDYLRLVSGNKINADLLLRDLIANYIFSIVLRHTPYAINSLRNLSMYFSPEQIEQRKRDAEEARKKYTQKPSEPPSKRTQAMIFMDLTHGYTEEDLVKRYRKMSLKLHPDKGGDKEDFIKLQNAFDTLR